MFMFGFVKRSKNPKINPTHCTEKEAQDVHKIWNTNLEKNCSKYMFYKSKHALPKSPIAM